MAVALSRVLMSVRVHHRMAAMHARTKTQNSSPPVDSTTAGLPAPSATTALACAAYWSSLNREPHTALLQPALLRSVTAAVLASSEAALTGNVLRTILEAVPLPADACAALVTSLTTRNELDLCLDGLCLSFTNLRLVVSAYFPGVH